VLLEERGPVDPIEALVVGGAQRAPFNRRRPVDFIDRKKSAPSRPGRA
jgi:hypothetical protein